jgi:hypothetical protein
MRGLRRVQLVSVFLALTGLLVPAPLLADGGATPAPALTDVALRPGGLLVGQLVNPQGKPLAKVKVTLEDDQGRELAATVTDEQGQFAIQGVRGGVHQIVTPQGRWFYRLWTSEMAPPSAQQGALIVVGDTVRGAPAKFWYTNPLVIGAVVATAIAVPVAVAANQHHHPASN